MARAERPDVVCCRSSRRRGSNCRVAVGAGRFLGLLARGRADTRVSACWCAATSPAPILPVHPGFRLRDRVASVRRGDLEVLTFTCPTAARISPRRCTFSRRSATTWPRRTRRATRAVVRRPERGADRLDLHPKERKPNAIGQRPDERALLQRVIDLGLTDVERALHPARRGCSPGGRPGATCASATSAGGSTTCWRRSCSVPPRHAPSVSASSARATTRRWSSSSPEGIRARRPKVVGLRRPPGDFQAERRRHLQSRGRPDGSAGLSLRTRP